MAAVKEAIGDEVLTSTWVFSLPFLGIFISIAVTWSSSTITGRSLFVLIFTLVGTALGGASFNHTTVSHSMLLASCAMRPTIVEKTRETKGEGDMGAVKAALGDAVLTSLWVFSLPFRGILSSIVVRFLRVQGLSLVSLFITTIVATVFVLTFNVVGNVMGGASFNPTTTVSSYAAGLKPNWSLVSIFVRFPAQATGAVGGAKAVLQFIPTQYKHMIKGPSLTVDLHTGAAVEGLLTFVFNLTIFVVMLKGPKSLFLQVWLVGVVTVGLFIAGSGYTGPSINPANAFGWAYVNNWHNNWEFFYVYWFGPFIGAISAAFVYRLLFQAKEKQKKA